ncbi:MAG: SigB/SigF/SigG family RNA polymerase sigma factor [Clostridiales bacterium]|jgi:RNA polymerase sporulation-specific sigma factor|nr:SigB/SigF/SigG family RNA polymerase sigma factor [Clostridiales bacterium]
MLDHETTLKYIESAKTGDEEAKSMLLEHNSPLLKSIIRRYKNKGVEYEDLYQLASVGLLKAIKNFDASFNVRFSTYAVPMIAGEIKRFLRDDGYIKISRALKSLSGKIAGFIENYKKQHFTDPDVNQIAAEFNIEPQEAVFAMDSARAPISLFEPAAGSGDQTASVIDRIAAPDGGEEVIDKLILKDMINALDDRDKKIVMLRYFKDKTQSEISRIMGVSQVQISRLENKIIERMKAGFSGE